jgi:4-amino-4-deoxy-L-arabinose transferase-like glycosyltransferase
MLLGLGLRAAWAMAGTGLDGTPWSDAADYHRLAARLAQGLGFSLGPDAAPYPTTFRPPLLPFLVAPFYALFGPRYGIGLLVQSGFGALTVPVAAALAGESAHAAGRDAVFAARARTGTAILVAVWPALVYFASALLTETLAALLVTVSLLLAVRLWSRGGAGLALGLGAALGLAALARPTALPLAAVLAAWIALGPARRPFRARLGEAVLVAFACLLTIAPWTARNHRVSGAWIPLTSGAGAALWDGNNPLVATDPRYRGGALSLREVEPWASSFRRMSEVEIDRHAATEAKAWLAAHRGDWPRLAAAKLARFFRASSETAVSGSAAAPGSWLGNLVRAIDPLLLTYGLLLPFFAGAALAALARPRKSPLAAPALAVLVQAALAAVYWGSLRFRAPVEPAIIVLGVSGALAAWAALRHRVAAPPGAEVRTV